MERTLVKFFSQPSQGERLIQVALDVAAHGFHDFQRSVYDRFWPASQAGAKARFFRFVRLKKELYVLALGAASRARWSAVHSGGRDGEYKIAVVTGITRLNCLPERGLIFFALILLNCCHFIGFREIKYRIACHHAGSIGRRSSVDHPDLAVKLKYFWGRFRVSRAPRSQLIYFNPSTR